MEGIISEEIIFGKHMRFFARLMSQYAEAALYLITVSKAGTASHFRSHLAPSRDVYKTQRGDETLHHTGVVV